MPDLIPCITVDGPSTTDKDDGIWLDPDGNIIVTVTAIGHRVTIDSDWDKSACERGESTYRANFIRHMFPRAFVEQSASLTTEEDRPVVAVRIDPSNGGLENPLIAIVRGRTRARSSMTYEEFAAVANGKKIDPESAMIIRMTEVARELLRRRRDTGALMIYNLNNDWHVTEEGIVVAAARSERNIGYIVIQEFMILANRMIAEYMIQNSVLGLFRNHKVSSAAPDRIELQAEIDQIQSATVPVDVTAQTRKRINMLLGRAEYAPVARGHFGLNLAVYSHTTSPLRRFADLVTQRALWNHLAGEQPPYPLEQLGAISDHLNAVIQARKDAQNAYFKAAADQHLARVIGGAVSSDEDMQLTQRNFSRLLKAAVESGEPSSIIAANLKRQIDRDTLTILDATTVLYHTPPGESWAQQRRCVLDWIQAVPSRAVEVTNVAAVVGTSLSPIVYVRTRPNGFEASTAGLVGAPVTWAYGTTKKEAIQVATVHYLAQMIGEVIEPAPAPPIPEIVKKPRILSYGAGLDDPVILEIIRGEDHARALSTLAARQRRKQPSIAFAFSAQGGQANVRCEILIMEGQ